MAHALHLSRGATFVAGLVLASALAPAVAVAATFSLVRIQGPSGDVAAVDGAHQLLVAESDPKSIVATGYPETDTGSCHLVKGLPASSGMVLRQLRVVVKASGAFDANHGIGLWPNRTCAGALVYLLLPPAVGSYTETFEPGIVVKAGAGVSVQALGGGVLAESAITGYLIPAAALP